MKNITIVGAGTLGSQISWQVAFMGFNVTVFDIVEKGLEACKLFHKEYAELFMNDKGATKEEIEQTYSRLNYTNNLKEAVKDADLVSESIPENIEIKKKFYQELGKVAPSKTIFATNSSSLLPSQFAKETGRPKQFLALHFANGIWDTNIGEVMGHSETDETIFNEVVAFAKNIGMVPIILKKEQPGYVINSLLIPLLASSLGLLAKQVSDVASIDKTWMISTGAVAGPLGMMDVIGLETVYNVFEGLSKQPKYNDFALLAEFVKVHYVEKGNLGVKSGKGFYSYPNPQYKEKNFLT